ncbi:OmpA family protein [Azonexus sp.]|uniref:OmpA family protein n=1 Tax=Azonexus sp. TaxID=1872668 RepID=UPI0027BA860F|nr:OmpA family protein [Azonexus sp.]
MSYRLIAQGVLFSLALSACSQLPPALQEVVPSSMRVSVGNKVSPELAAPPPARSSVSEKTLIAEVDAEHSIFFPSSGVTVDSEGRARLIEHANRLKASPDLVVTLIGHTDDLGSPSYNLAIAEQRVNAVYAILRSQRVPLTQIRRYGVGNEQMDRACKSEACRKKMRRVELVFGE